MTAISISFPFSVEKQASAYIQVGDLLQMFFHRGRSELAACDFCQTMNSGNAKSCAGCGGKLRNSFGNADALSSFSSRFLKEAKVSAPASIALRVLSVSLLMSAGLGFWLLVHPTAPWTSDSLISPSTAIQRETTPNAVHETESGSVIEPFVLKDTTSADRSNARGEEEIVASAEPKTTTISSPVLHSAYKSRPEKITLSRSTSTAHPGFRKPFTGCDDLNFLARAICINNRCAEPRPAQQLQCRKAVHQRRVDEARRNSL